MPKIKETNARNKITTSYWGNFLLSFCDEKKEIYNGFIIVLKRKEVWRMCFVLIWNKNRVKKEDRVIISLLK